MAKEKFNVPETISGFTVPLGSQMNYDGSVILYGCVILFISQTIGVPVTLGTMVKIILMSAIPVSYTHLRHLIKVLLALQMI